MSTFGCLVIAGGYIAFIMALGKMMSWTWHPDKGVNRGDDG